MQRPPTDIFRYNSLILLYYIAKIKSICIVEQCVGAAEKTAFPELSLYHLDSLELMRACTSGFS